MINVLRGAQLLPFFVDINADKLKDTNKSLTRLVTQEIICLMIVNFYNRIDV
jgi:hypothetical protein